MEEGTEEVVGEVSTPRNTRARIPVTTDLWVTLRPRFPFIIVCPSFENLTWL
jgi:hypothetical protein